MMCACLSYLLSMQQDLAGLCTIDERVQIELPPGSSPAHLDRLFKSLERAEAGGGTGLVEGLHQLAERLPRRSLLVMVSDLWVEPEAFLKALQHLRYRKHQILVLHLTSPAEMDLPYTEQLTLQDLETGERLQIDPAEIREAYREQTAQFVQQIRRGCNDAGAEYH